MTRPPRRLSGEYGPLSANHHYGQPRRTRVGSPGRTRAGDGSLFTLRPAAKRGWLDLHPEIDGMIQAPEDADGAAADGAPRAPPPAWDTTHQSSECALANACVHARALLLVRAPWCPARCRPHRDNAPPLRCTQATAAALP